MKTKNRDKQVIRVLRLLRDESYIGNRQKLVTAGIMLMEEGVRRIKRADGEQMIDELDPSFSRAGVAEIAKK